MQFESSNLFDINKLNEADLIRIRIRAMEIYDNGNGPVAQKCYEQAMKERNIPENYFYEVRKKIDQIPQQRKVVIKKHSRDRYIPTLREDDYKMRQAGDDTFE